MQKLNDRRNMIFLSLIFTSAHFLLCFISGQWWDDWTIWPTPFDEIKSIFLRAGGPWEAYNLLSVMWIPNWGYRLIVFILYLAVCLLFYKILRSVDFLSKEDAFWISAITTTLPVNDARVTLICFGYSLSLFLFMLSFFLVTKLYWNNKKSIRVLAIITLLYSYITQSLLVFTGLIWLYLFYKTWQYHKNRNLKENMSTFLYSYWDFILLPFVFFIMHSIFFKPYGEYSEYNVITLHSFLKAFISTPIAVLRVAALIIRSYLLQLGILSISCLLVIYLIFSCNKSKTELDKRTYKDYLIFFFLGFFICIAGLFPYVVIRGWKISTTGVNGRDALLVGFGGGMTAFFFIRSLPLKRYIQNFFLISLIVLGIFHFNDWYLNYQEGWYHQQEIATAIKKNNNFSDDNTIFCDFFYDPTSTGLGLYYVLNGISYMTTHKMDKFYFGHILHLEHGIEFNKHLLHNCNMNDYDYSDRTIDGILFINNAPINNMQLIKMRFNEIYHPDIFNTEITKLTDIKYIKIDKAISDIIYKMYKENTLTQENLRAIINAEL